MTQIFQAFINGQWSDSVSGDTLSITNPATGHLAAHAAKCGVPDLENAIAAAEKAGPAWGRHTGCRTIQGAAQSRFSDYGQSAGTG